MTRSEGTGVFVSGTTHRPLPTGTATWLAGKPARPKPAGLDWAAHRAPDVSPAPAPSPPVRAPKVQQVEPKVQQPGLKVQERAPRLRRASTTLRPATRLDPAAIIDAYQAGQTTPAIARAHGTSPKRIRALLDEHHIERRDDRATHSGGKPRDYGDDLVANVRRLYVDEQLSQVQVAKQLKVPHKTVVTIMLRHQIPIRQRQSGHLDGAAPLKQRMARLGANSAQIKAWALQDGLVARIQRGIPSEALVAAYERAHGLQEET